MDQTQILFFSLLRAALWGEKLDASSFAEANWTQIFHLADVQTVQSLVLDGMGMLPPESLCIPLQEKLKRIGGMQQMERMNSLHRNVIIKIDKVGHRLIHEHHGMAWVDGVTVEPHDKVHNYQRSSTDRAMQELLASVYPEGLAKANIEPFSYQEEEWATFMVDDIMRVGNFGRGEYVFQHQGWLDAWRNYRWVAKRCWTLGFVCPSEARWWMVSKIARFFWKKGKGK